MVTLGKPVHGQASYIDIQFRWMNCVGGLCH